jgi:hypothetical protein
MCPRRLALVAHAHLIHSPRACDSSSTSRADGVSRDEPLGPLAPEKGSRTMNARSLTPQQRGALRGRLLRQREYFGRRVAQMDALGFPADDPVRVAEVEARDKVGRCSRPWTPPSRRRRSWLTTARRSRSHGRGNVGRGDRGPAMGGEAEGEAETVSVWPQVGPSLGPKGSES